MEGVKNYPMATDQVDQEPAITKAMLKEQLKEYQKGYEQLNKRLEISKFVVENFPKWGGDTQPPIPPEDLFKVLGAAFVDVERVEEAVSATAEAIVELKKQIKNAVD